MNVAITLFGPGRHAAPLDDPEWRIWTLAGNVRDQSEVLFEIHHDWREREHYAPDAAAHLRNTRRPVVMREAFEDVPNAVRFDMEAAAALAGEPYMQSSFAFMVAHAINEGAAAIGVWGFDMDDPKYAHQRQNAEFWLGLARGRGIEVSTQPESTLLKYRGTYGEADWIKPGSAEWQ